MLSKLTTLSLRGFDGSPATIREISDRIETLQHFEFIGGVYNDFRAHWDLEVIRRLLARHRTTLASIRIGLPLLPDVMTDPQARLLHPGTRPMVELDLADFTNLEHLDLCQNSTVTLKLGTIDKILAPRLKRFAWSLQRCEDCRRGGRPCQGRFNADDRAWLRGLVKTACESGSSLREMQVNHVCQEDFGICNPSNCVESLAKEFQDVFGIVVRH
jgi:hypothetical protein